MDIYVTDEDPFWRWTSPEDIRLAKRSYQLAADLRTIRKAGSDAMVSFIRAGDDLAVTYWRLVYRMEGIESEAQFQLSDLHDDIVVAGALTLREMFDHLDPNGEEL